MRKWTERGVVLLGRLGRAPGRAVPLLREDGPERDDDRQQEEEREGQDSNFETAVLPTEDSFFSRGSPWSMRPVPAL